MSVCFECNSGDNLIKHHVVPRSRGGTKTVFLCQICHDKVHGHKRLRNVSISQLTRDGLQKAKSRGVNLGNPQYKLSLPKAVEANKYKANIFSEKMIPLIVSCIDRNLNLREICEELNSKGITTSYGNLWSPPKVWTYLKNKNIKYERSKI